MRCICFSYDRGSTYNVYVGKKQLIEGMDKALVGMCVNERSLVKIPPHLAYGKQGYGVYNCAFLKKKKKKSSVLDDVITDQEAEKLTRS